VKKLVLVALVAACGHSSPGMQTADASSDGAGGDGAVAVDAAPDANPVIPTPDTCPQGDECGSAASCVNGACVCDDGYRACAGGCCAVDLETVTLDNAWGDDVRLQVAPDGTAYILVDQRISESGTAQQLHLYSRAPGSAIVDTGWVVPVDYYQGMFDFAIKTDGTLMVAYAPNYSEGSYVELVSWKNGVASQPLQIGSGFGYDMGISVAVAPDDTLWVTWSSSRSGGLSAYSVDAGGTQRTYNLGSNGTVEETDVEYDATTGGMYSFYGHRYTGNFVSGVVPLAGATPLSSTCPADSAVFDRSGHVWATYNSYSTIHTYACRDGQNVMAGTDALPVNSNRAFTRPRIALDAQDTAFLADYDPYMYVATWWSSTSNLGWSHGTLPTHYGIVPGWNRPGFAYTALASGPHGQMAIAVVPESAQMGAMVLATFR
jgi:hypothetical protein